MASRSEAAKRGWAKRRARLEAERAEAYARHRKDFDERYKSDPRVPPGVIYVFCNGDHKQYVDEEPSHDGS